MSVNEVLEVFPPDDRGEFQRLEKFHGCRHYMTYGSKESGLTRMLYWSGMLNMCQNDTGQFGKLSGDEIHYAKEQLDYAYQSAFGHRDNSEESSR